MPENVLRPYESGQLAEVADLLALAYLENPLHVVVFGGTGEAELRAHRTLFELSLPVLQTGTKMVALRDGVVVGFAHWVPYPGCRPPPEAMAEVAPQLFAKLDGEVVSRIVTWRRAWGEVDPEGPHSHFGPFAVHPSVQGQGIGRRLMEHYCASLDRNGELAYLETERPENLEIYRKAGFEVTAEREVLGLPSWFMTRLQQPASSTPGEA
jgi:ribosomal protein S18 acetylase RimI-like enzyme